jgi:AbiV family abortive infection protein
MKKKLDAYRGRLTAAQIAAGMNAASANARRLSEDAEKLLIAGRFPTAGSLAALAIEESGKISLLRELALAKTDAEAAEVWRGYRSHTRKSTQWLVPQLAVAGARRLVEFRSLFEESAEHPFLLDQLKQLGFYTDCLGSAHWAVPWQVIDEGLARTLVDIAKLLAGKDEHTEREIALWIEHIGPVWKKDQAWMEQALINWYGAMQAQGLAAQGPNRMEHFIRGGPSDKDQ